MVKIIQNIIFAFELIKFSHSVFALPFALAAMIVAAKGLPDSKTFLLIVCAMVTARSAAMAFNRWTDADIDARNPRTQSRHIPRGLLTRKFVMVFTLVSVTLFAFICYHINPLAFYFSPFVTAWIILYSLAKRFTWFTHVWLGISLGLSAPAAWVAVTGQMPWPALSLGVAVVFWVAGFDILYAMQDADFDRETGIHSIVARFGKLNALRISRLFHFLTVVGMIFFGIQNGLHTPYWITLILVTLALFYEQSLVKPHDLSRINTAFFNVNGLIGLLFLAGILLEFRFGASG